MIKLVTDYHSSLPETLLEEYDVRLIPTYILFGRERLREGVDITAAQFYQRLEESATTPTTAPPSYQELQAMYQAMLDEAPDTTILSIHLSGKMSKVVEYAQKAVEELDGGSIHIFDSQTVGIPEGLMVRQAATMAAAGADIETILDTLATMRDTARLFFIIDTLAYLAEGGRIGKATQIVGTTFNLKPMLTVHQGEVSSYARFTGREKAIASLKSLVVEVTRNKSHVQIGVTHGNCLDDANRLADEIGQQVQAEVLLVSEIPPAIGVHSGPGVLGVGWYIPPQDGPEEGLSASNSADV